MSDKLLKEIIMNTPIMNQSTRNLDIELSLAFLAFIIVFLKDEKEWLYKIGSN